MFESRNSSASLERLGDRPESDSLDIRAILGACTALPPIVATVDFTRVNARIVDDELLKELSGDSADSRGTPDRSDRRKRRMRVLTEYLNKTLVCIFIRLPGVHYTIEIDPEMKSVVYWEWQST